jgi:predicted helicase
LVKNAKDFEAFHNAGKTLAALHLKYETIKPYPKVKIIGEEKDNFKVEKMRFGKNSNNEKDK